MVSQFQQGQELADRDLERRVAAFLADRHLPSLRRLRVEANSGTVTLRGEVRTFYEKQVGQHSARRVAGVLNVVDAIDVASAPSTVEARPASPVVLSDEWLATSLALLELGS